MLDTFLNLTANRTNAGTTAVIATLDDGSQHLVGESQSIGRKRAILDVLSAGSGSHIARTLARLERRQEALEQAAMDLANAELEAAADELGIDLYDALVA